MQNPTTGEVIRAENSVRLRVLHDNNQQWKGSVTLKKGPALSGSFLYFCYAKSASKRLLSPPLPGAIVL